MACIAALSHDLMLLWEGVVRSVSLRANIRSRVARLSYVVARRPSLHVVRGCVLGGSRLEWTEITKVEGNLGDQVVAGWLVVQSRDGRC